MRAMIVFTALFCSVALLAGLESSQSVARAGNLQWAAADHGKNCFIDLDSLKFITEPNGQQVADVWIKCEVDDAARARMIDARYGQQESVEGFELLTYVKQHVWFNLVDPAYRNPSSLPLRMIAQEVYYDTYGEVIHSTVPLITWRGGKWFTIPGFEEIVQKIMAARARK
jgi:hypothetical protein